MRECYWSPTAPLDSLFFVSFSILQESTFLSLLKAHPLYVFSLFLCYSIYINSINKHRNPSQNSKLKVWKRQRLIYLGAIQKTCFRLGQPLFHVPLSPFLQLLTRNTICILIFSSFISENRRHALIKILYVGKSFVIKGISSSASSHSSSRQAPILFPFFQRIWTVDLFILLHVSKNLIFNWTTQSYMYNYRFISSQCNNR